MIQDAVRAPLAIVTMVYNEADFLPVWIRHYAAQAGSARCYVVDHGSDDGSTDAERLPPELNLLRIPRSPQDDDRRSGFISRFCASLLTWYESVVYVDVDELLVADPTLHASLIEFAAQLSRDAVVTAIGLDVVHRPDDEPGLDWRRPVSRQRRWLRFSSSMCKPVLIRRAVAWAPGLPQYRCGAGLRDAVPVPPALRGHAIGPAAARTDPGAGLEPAGCRIAPARRRCQLDRNAARHRRPCRSAPT
nr:glycosyltransferase family 2 protein [uncultured Lichenicoccus sp.]